MEQLVTEYKYYLQSVKMMSSNGIDAYVNDVTNYVNYLITKILVDDMKQVTSEHIRSYLAFLKKKKMTTSSLSRNLSSIKSFHRFLTLDKYVDTNVSKEISAPKIDKKLPTVLSVEEVMKLLEVVQGEKPYDLRNMAMLELIYATGLRVSELCTLKVTDMRFTSKQIRIFGKGSKERIVPVNDYALKKVRDYIIQARPVLQGMKKDSGFLFLNNHGEAISRVGFFKILKNLTDEAGIDKNVGSHSLRKTWARNIYDNAGDKSEALVMLQECLRHSDSLTTLRYISIMDEEKKDMYESIELGLDYI